MQQQLAALPKGLEGIYEKILSSSSHPADLKQFLQWLAFSTRTMRVEEIAEVVVVDLHSGDGPSYAPNRRYMDPKNILRVCSSLVTEFNGTVKWRLPRYIS